MYERRDVLVEANVLERRIKCAYEKNGSLCPHGSKCHRDNLMLLLIYNVFLHTIPNVLHTHTI